MIIIFLYFPFAKWVYTNTGAIFHIENMGGYWWASGFMGLFSDKANSIYATQRLQAVHARRVPSQFQKDFAGDASVPDQKSKFKGLILVWLDTTHRWMQEDRFFGGICISFWVGVCVSVKCDGVLLFTTTPRFQACLSSESNGSNWRGSHIS